MFATDFGTHLLGPCRYPEQGENGLAHLILIKVHQAVESLKTLVTSKDEVGAQIGLRCGYSTPDSVLQGICEELRDQGIPGIVEQLGHSAWGLKRQSCKDLYSYVINLDPFDPLDFQFLSSFNHHFSWVYWMIFEIVIHSSRYMFV